MGSPAVTAWVAHLAFWILVVCGRMSGELGTRGILVAVSLWAAAYLGLPFVPYGAAFFPAVVAVLDIALVLLIFKSDVRIR